MILQIRRAMTRRGRDQRGLTLMELLVSMSIMGVISAMLLITWFALSKSYAFSTHSADARDSGRQAMQRLQREIRDAQKPPQGYLGTTASGAPDAIIFRARAYWIAFSTTFNDAGNDTAAWAGSPTPAPAPTHPHLVVYRLYSDGELWRFEDLNENGKIDRSSGQQFDMSSEYPNQFDVTEQDDGEGATLIVKDVVNWRDTAHRTPLFHYNEYDGNGVLQSQPALYNSDRQAIIAVPIRMLVDLDPTKAPVFADLRGTAQLRNAR